MQKSEPQENVLEGCSWQVESHQKKTKTNLNVSFEANEPEHMGEKTGIWWHLEPNFQNSACLRKIVASVAL